MGAFAHAYGLDNERAGFPLVAPTSISGLILDLNPAVAASLNPVGGVLSDGVALQGATDQSATGMVFAQATSTKRPAYVASSGAGHPAIRFNRTNVTSLANASTSLWTGNPAFTIACVLSVPDLTQGTFFSLGTNGTRAGIACIVNRTSLAGRLDLASSGAVIGLYNAGNIIAVNTPFLAIITLPASGDITAASAYKDGSALQMTTQTAGVLNVVNSKTWIGESVTSTGAGLALSADVFRLLVWNRVLTVAERQGLQSWVSRNLLH